MNKKIIAVATAALFSVNSVWACIGGVVEVDISKLGFAMKRMVVTASGVAVRSQNDTTEGEVHYNQEAHKLIVEAGEIRDGKFKQTLARTDFPIKKQLNYYKPKQSAEEINQIAGRIHYSDAKETVVPTGATSGGKVITHTLRLEAVPNKTNPNVHVRVEMGESDNVYFTVVTLVKDGKDMKSFFVHEQKIAGGKVKSAGGPSGKGTESFDPAITTPAGTVEVPGCGGKTAVNPVNQHTTDSTKTKTNGAGSIHEER